MVEWKVGSFTEMLCEWDGTVLVASIVSSMSPLERGEYYYQDFVASLSKLFRNSHAEGTEIMS